jgi:CMP-N,N'-diacetyllegionaminic acid synthase
VPRRSQTETAHPGDERVIRNERVVAVIPARGGSKSIPKKNIVPLGGRPLIAWSIEVAQRTPAVDRILVSTDDGEIERIATGLGAEVYRRPAALSTDDALVIDALRDLVRTLNSEGEQAAILVLLEPTCPLRSVDDVAQCIDLVSEGWDSAATFRSAELHPHRAWRIVEGAPEPFIDGAVPWLPRQRLPEAYQLNGAVYVVRTEDLLDESAIGLLFGRTAAVVMPAERSVDIDTAHDLLVAEALLRAQLAATSDRPQSLGDPPVPGRRPRHSANDT